MRLYLTQQAAQHIQSIPGSYLRVQVKSGGCSGLRYLFSLESGPLKEKDHAYDSCGAVVVSDALSLSFIGESTIDYKEELMGANFVLTNPKAVGGCGCGESFSVS